VEILKNIFILCSHCGEIVGLTHFQSVASSVAYIIYLASGASSLFLIFLHVSELFGELPRVLRVGEGKFLK